MKLALRTRIAWQFLWRLVLLDIFAVFVYLLSIIALIYFLGTPDSKNTRDFLVKVVDQTQVRQGKIQIPASIQRELKERNQWLQILDEEGEEVFQFRRPRLFPSNYSPGELVELKDRDDHGYHLSTWYEKREGKTWTWILGKHNDQFLIQQLIQHHTKYQQGKVFLDQAGKERLKQAGQWLQIIDEFGKEVYQFSKPASVSNHYTPGELSYLVKYDYMEDQLLTIQNKKFGERKWTLIVGKPLPQATQTNPRLGLGLEQQNWITMASLFTLVIGVLGVTVLSLLFGKRLGEPMLHVISWIQNLAKGNFQEPLGKEGVPRSKVDPSGPLKRKYRIYQEVIDSMDQLTETLQKNQQDQRRLQQTREEWIASVSHDLKTPLSSVKGYAELLSTQEYHWKPEEIQQYVKVIREKANYMENLIEDLSLTFRLKNNALPFNKQKLDLVEVVRRVVIDITNDPKAAKQEMEFLSEESEIVYPIDPQWFHRALTNLLMNAVIHNPPGTQIQVTIHRSIQSQEILIRIQDNGRGMDSETQEHLFDRYYRGTNTKQQAAGTGLGMAIAKQLIEVHGGTIQLESKLGKGTTLTLRFPSSM